MRKPECGKYIDYPNRCNRPSRHKDECRADTVIIAIKPDSGTVEAIHFNACSQKDTEFIEAYKRVFVETYHIPPEKSVIPTPEATYKFYGLFGVPIWKYWCHLTRGLDVVKFDEQYLKTPDGISTSDYLAQRFGQEARDFVESLI